VVTAFVVRKGAVSEAEVRLLHAQYEQLVELAKNEVNPTRFPVDRRTFAARAGQGKCFPPKVTASDLHNGA